jgi:hypothetical protein
MTTVLAMLVINPSVTLGLRLQLLPRTEVFKFTETLKFSRGPGSSAGVATGYGLDGPGIESRWG